MRSAGCVLSSPITLAGKEGARQRPETGKREKGGVGALDVRIALLEGKNLSWKGGDLRWRRTPAAAAWAERGKKALSRKKNFLSHLKGKEESLEGKGGGRAP